VTDASAWIGFVREVGPTSAPKEINQVASVDVTSRSWVNPESLAVNDTSACFVRFESIKLADPSSLVSLENNRIQVANGIHDKRSKTQCKFVSADEVS
jgi:hypothetical protein